jgi:tol-pal system protein YbgF
MRRLLTAIVLVAALPGVGRAANREMERLMLQVATLQTQVSELQRLADESLKEVKRLNEQLAAQTASAQKAMDDRRMQDEAVQLALKDLGRRLGELSERMQASAIPAPPSFGAPPADMEGASGAPGPAIAGAAPPAPRELYSQSYADYARGNYDVALQGFQEYIRAYPNTDFSDNAQYWIGECLYGKQRYEDAVEAWNTLFRDFPSSDKLPDARFKKGLALERLGRRSQALVEYRYVADRYPNTEAGRKARERLGAP